MTTSLPNICWLPSAHNSITNAMMVKRAEKVRRRTIEIEIKVVITFKYPIVLPAISFTCTLLIGCLVSIFRLLRRLRNTTC